MLPGVGVVAENCRAFSLAPSVNFNGRVGRVQLKFFVCVGDSLFDGLVQKKEAISAPVVELHLIDWDVVGVFSLVAEELRPCCVRHCHLEMVAVLEPQVVDQC